MRLIARKAGGVLGAVAGVLGAAGMPDNIAWWNEWLSASEPYINNGWARFALIASGFALLGWSLTGHIGPGQFVPLSVAAARINSITFRRSRYIYPLTEAAEELSGRPRTDFYQQFLIRDAIDGKLMLYEKTENANYFNPVSVVLLKRRQLPDSRLAMHKSDLQRYMNRARLSVLRAWFKSRAQR